jgi:iron complex outermembrane receptor protein
MSNSATPLKKSSLLGCAALGALCAGMLCYSSAAQADDPAAETVVVTGTHFNTDAAPAKASLDTTEPETIINRPYIENFVPPQSDYVTILAIVPSMTGGDSNGPGLSDGGAKNTLRGLPDGNFVMQYDGIPFGDTNGPTHHNISYFPASTIGQIVVDRGPGNAGNLGASTYGGTIKLFSETLDDDPTAKGAVSYGSFDTFYGNLNAQSGTIDLLGTTAKVLFNGQDLQSSGALSDQNLFTENLLLKVQDEIAPNWTVTLFGDYSYLKENLDDNNGLTPSQVFVYGKNFALESDNPNLPTYAPYNYTSKSTDMEYLRVNGNVTSTLTVENTGYTYAYWNNTFSPNSQTQTLSQIQTDTSGDNQTVKLFSNGTSIPNQILAYDKENEYRTWGDVLRASQDYDFGWVSGQVRAGIWWEAQATHRYKFYFDASLCDTEGVNPFDVGGPQAAQDCGVVKGSFHDGDLGYGKDNEYSSWTQYEPFLEVDIRPTDNLVITPGVKFIHWDHSVDAPIEQGSGCGVSKACPPFNTLGENYRAGFITRDALPFVQANYKIDTSWSVYAEYAKGVYVPDISSFEGGSPTQIFPAPEETTNYQVGTVFYSDNFTADGDVYYIPISNNYTSVACVGDPSDLCFQNTGQAVYKGVEAEGTYAFNQQIDGFDLTGLSVFANGAFMYSKSQGKWIENAPRYTAAAGVLYAANGWKFSLIDKQIGPQFSDNGDLDRFRLKSYSDVFGSIGYQYGRYEIDFNVDNLLDTRPTTLITESGADPQPYSWKTATDQYIFQAPRSFMITLKAHL